MRSFKIFPRCPTLRMRRKQKPPVRWQAQPRAMRKRLSFAGKIIRPACAPQAPCRCRARGPAPGSAGCEPSARAAFPPMPRCWPAALSMAPPTRLRKETDRCTTCRGRAGSSVWRRKATTAASSALVSTVERGSFGPVFRSSTVARFRHVGTVLGLMPSSRLNAASAAPDRCIAARTACVVAPDPAGAAPRGPGRAALAGGDDNVHRDGPARWAALPPAERARLLRWPRVWWDVHRFRIVPLVEPVLDRRIAEGRLAMLAGRLLSARQVDGAVGRSAARCSKR